MTNSIRTKMLLVLGAGLLVAAAYALTLPTFVAAQTGFGNYQEQDNFVALTSNTQNAPTNDDFGGVHFEVASGTTVASLDNLSARYNVVNTDCGGGSPRFQLNVANGTTTGNIFVYLGPSPSYSGCAQNTWTLTGNLLDNAHTVDTSQLPGGTFYQSWSAAEASYGSWQVTGVQLVVDAGWATGGIQRARFTDVGIGGTNYVFPMATSTPPPATTTLAAPTPVSPANGSTLTSAAWSTADWTDVTATATPVTYRYESSNSAATNPDGSFASPIFTSGVLTDSQISTAGTPEGTYYWHARAVDNNGTMSPWSSTVQIIVSNATTTPPNGGSNQDLIDALKALQAQFPQFFWNLQWVIDDLMDDGSPPPPPPPAGTPSIDNNGTTIGPNGHLDFVGRNFGRDEMVDLRLNGSLLRTVRADGGGNFSTGSMSGPGSAGTYHYVFRGQSSGLTATSTITVSP